MPRAFSSRSTARPPPWTRTAGPSPRRTSVGERADEARVLEGGPADLVDAHAHEAVPPASAGESAETRPSASGQPIARFRFWMAWPAAPFTRLSRAEKTTARPGAAAWTEIRQSFVSDHVGEPRRRAVHDVDEGRAVVGGLQRPLSSATSAFGFT